MKTEPLRDVHNLEQKAYSNHWLVRRVQVGIIARPAQSTHLGLADPAAGEPRISRTYYEFNG